MHDVPIDDVRTDVLRAGPFWVMSALTGRSVMTDDEQRVWADALAVLDGPALALIVDRDPSDTPRLIIGDDRSVLTGLTDIATVLGTLDPLQAADYRRLLLSFGLAVATARGPFGRSVTAEDRQILLLCAALIEPAGGRRSVPLAA